MLYVVADIHGQLTQLTRALSLIEQDGGREGSVVFLGDYTDRGPDSRAVIDTLIEGRDAGRNWQFIKGNHDRMFCYFMEEEPREDPRLRSGLTWRHDRLGGAMTLASYGVNITASPAKIHAEAREKVPAAHIEFLEAAQLYIETEAFICVHAGLRPGTSLEDQLEDDLLWIRGDFLESDEDFGKLIVHGHTVVDFPEHRGNRINLDGGAGYGRDLWPARFDGQDCTLLTDRGPLALTPS